MRDISTPAAVELQSSHRAAAGTLTGGVMRKQYELTEEELKTLMDACKPVPYMVVGVEPRSPQENANTAWQSLGRKRGFQWDTVAVMNGQGNRFFTAEEL